MKRILFVAILIASCAAGLLFRATFEKKPSQAQTFLSLFESHCADLVKGASPAPMDGLVKVQIGVEDFLWGEPEFGLAVRLNLRGCTVTDLLKPIPVEERAKLDALVTDYVSSTWPNLRERMFEKIATWDLHKVWVARGTDETCSPYIQFFRPGAGAGDPATHLEAGRLDRARSTFKLTDC